MDTVKVVILGDVCPNSDNQALFMEGQAGAVFNDVIGLIRKADIAVCNLEEPLTNAKEKVKKSGPSLSAPPECICALREAGISVAGLANNHIRDYGDQGVKDTISACRDACIEPFGAGETIHQACQMLVKSANGKRIGFLGISDNECSYATEKRAGAYGYDDLETMDWVQSCKQKCDYLIILYHSGLEHYEYPSPLLQRRGRKMIEKGADAIICQHSHCLGSMEEYNNGVIVYGQGNCLFAKKGANEKWTTGCLIALEIEDKRHRVDYIPIRMTNGTVSCVSGKDAERILESFYKRSDQIKQDGFVQQMWNSWNTNHVCQYFGILLGFGRYRYKMNALFGNTIGKVLLRKKEIRNIANVIRCESHRESLLHVLNDYEGQEEK